MKKLVTIFFVISFLNVFSYCQTQSELNIEGTYVNSANQTINITNYAKGVSIDYIFKYGVKDNWGCIFEGKGTANIFENNISENEKSLLFYIGDLEFPELTIEFSDMKTILLNASPDYIGMDCFKFGESQDETYTVFKRN